MVKILYSAKNFYPPKGGAEISMDTMLKKAAGKNEIHVLYHDSTDQNYLKDGLYLHPRCVGHSLTQLKYLSLYFENLKWRKILDNYLRINSTDLILTQLEFAPSIVELAKQYKIPSILFIRDYFHFCPIGFANGIDCDKRCWCCLPNQNSGLYNALKWGQDILQYPFTRKMLKWSKYAVKNADAIVTNSIFMSNLTKKWFHVDVDYIYPFVDVASIKSAGNTGEYITFIKPDLLKGAKIFINIAERLKNNQFLCVGNIPKYCEYKKDLQDLKNVKFIGWTNDMETVYSKTKVLLVPSIWPEPFGRVCVEAMANGIPSIVSNRGGLPEVVGDAGIVINNIFCTDEWTAKINQIYSDSTYYGELSRKAKKRSELFNFGIQYNKIENIIGQLTT